MSNMSDYLEGQLLTHIFRTSSYSKPTTIAIALCTSTPSDSSTGATIAEVTNANNYSRVTVNPDNANWTAIGVGGTTDNAAEIAFAQASGSWGTVTSVAILDSATHGAGNLLFYGDLAVAKAITSGDTFKFAIGDLNITLA